MLKCPLCYSWYDGLVGDAQGNGLTHFQDHSLKNGSVNTVNTNEGVLGGEGWQVGLNQVCMTVDKVGYVVVVVCVGWGEVNWM